MSLYKDASLVMIPSAYKDGKLYSIRPTDGSGDFTFSRGSNLAATRVDVNGLIEKGRENVLLQSNQFDTTWSLSSSITITSGQSGYDGTNDAWLLKRSDASSRFIFQNLSAGSSVYTFSFYAKPESENWAYVYSFNGSSAITAYFDLQNGVVGVTSGSVISTNIQAAGNGYYRCSLTYNTSVSQVRIYPAVGNDSVTGGVTDAGVYIQDAQLEAGLVATDYIETGASTAQAGILEDMPRLDYSGSCPALLLEPQRSNLIPQSEPFSGGDWLISSSAAIVSNAAVSPQGVQNAAEVQGPSGSSFIYDVLNLTASTTHTTSFYIKNNNSTRTQFFAANESTYSINWDGLTIDSVDSGVYYESVGNNWYRVWSTQDSNSDGQFITRFYPSNAGASVYLYGYQVESGSYPTSYIPTYGSSVTRNPDRCYLQSADVHSDNSGTMFFEVGDYDTATAPDGFRKIITANAVSASNLDNIIYFEEYAGNNTILIRKNGSTLLQTTPSYQDLRNSKIAIKWSDEGAKVFINGVLNKSYTGDASLNLQYFGHATSYSGDVLSTIAMKQRVHFPTALTDSECIALTTI